MGIFGAGIGEISRDFHLCCGGGERFSVFSAALWEKNIDTSIEVVSVKGWGGERYPTFSPNSSLVAVDDARHRSSVRYGPCTRP